MSWFLLWHEMIKNGSVRYILQRYLGQYFEEKLSVEQLSVDLSKGIGSISNIVLDVQALNELGEQYNLPVEFVDGSITKVTVRVPWSSILTESSSVQIDGLSLVIQPKQREDCATSMFESMWSCMTTSIQLAEECLKQSAESNPEKPVNGVHEVAKAIDTVFARVKVDFYDTIIRLEHLPKDTCHGSAIKINIKHFSYQDETNPESFDDMPTMPTSAYSVKRFCFDGVDFCSNEFYASHRTMCRSLLMESNMNEQQSKMNDTDSIVFAKFLGKQEIRLKIKQKENVSGPKFDVEMNGSSLVSYISPRQLRTVCEVLCGLMSPHLQDSSNMCNKSRVNAKPMTTSDYERVEQELNQHINPSSLNHFVSKSLQNAAGWSSAGGLEDESDDDFHPVAGHVDNSLTSSVSNSVSSSCHSTSSSYHLSSKASEQYSFPSQSSSHYQQGRLKEKNGELFGVQLFQSYRERNETIQISDKQKSSKNLDTQLQTRQMGPDRKCQALSKDQFEQNRKDGWKKLKPNAIPTKFPDSNSQRKQRSKTNVDTVSSQDEAIPFGSDQLSFSCELEPLINHLAKPASDSAATDMSQDMENTLPGNELELEIAGYSLARRESTATASAVYENSINHLKKPASHSEATEISENMENTLPGNELELEIAGHSLARRESTGTASAVYENSPARNILQELSAIIKFYEEQQKVMIQQNKFLMSQYEITLKFIKESNEQHHRELAEATDKFNALINQISKFLSSDQIKSLQYDKMKEWSKESIILGLKLRFALGVHGYNYLRSTKYPIPSYSTLTKRLSQYQISPGIFSDLKEPLMFKINCLEPADRFCSLSIDEMEIEACESFSKTHGKFLGYVTLGTDYTAVGTHLLVVLIRGIRSPWKQAIAAEITGRSIAGPLTVEFMNKCIEFVESCGLHVVSITSDMGSSNTAFWSCLDIGAKKNGHRNNSFTANGHPIFILPDACHLLKNLKQAMLKFQLRLPPHIVEMENLPTPVIDGKYISTLWEAEIRAKKIIRSLYHLSDDDICPDNYQKMNVGSAMRYFSDKTAIAIELAVDCKILPLESLTTSWFIKLISDWFELVSSRHRKTSITKRNQETKLNILQKMIDVMHGIRAEGKWKPWNRGIILSCLSLTDISRELFEQSGFDFILFSRFTQDALENVFSQVRRRAGSMPSAAKCFST